MKQIVLTKVYKIGERPRGCNPERVFDEIKSVFDAGKEYFIVIHLDTKLNIICREIVHIGGLNQTLIEPRAIFKNAIVLNADSIILAHNHPSGVLEASEEDIEVTKKLKEIGKLLQINVIDHIIFSNNNFKSIIDVVFQ